MLLNFELLLANSCLQAGSVKYYDNPIYVPSSSQNQRPIRLESNATMHDMEVQKIDSIDKMDST